MTKPTARPNPVRLAVLGGLTTTKQGTRNHKTWDHDANDVVITQVPVVVAPAGLAANVSSESVDRLAARWAR